MSDLDIPFRNLGQASGDSSPSQKEAFKTKEDSPENEDARAMGQRVLRTVENSAGMQRSWQQVAKEAYRYYDGHQWDDYDRMIMQQSRRPILTFNEIKKVIRGICGLERMNRTDVRFVARPLDSSRPEDTASDLATEAVSAVDDISDAPTERSLVVKDVVIGGLGWIETRMDFSEDLDGKILKERLPPFEMFWDIYARRPGLVDRRWCARKRNMPRDEFKKRWPDMIDLVDMAAPEPEEWRVSKYELVTPYYSLANEKVNPQVGEQSPVKSTIPVIQFQERYQVEVYRMADPENPMKLMEMSKRVFNQFKKDLDAEGLPMPPYVRQTKSKYRQIYVAHGVRLEEPVDLPGNRYSIQCSTGEWDEERKLWTGIVCDMIDPQKTKNKSLSTALHFYVTNAKGGVMFEAGSFVNESRAKDEWSSPNPWIQVNPGMLDRIVPRKPADMPPALQAFFQISTQSISGVSGISDEILGLGTAEMGNQTQQARMGGTMAVLGWLWDEIHRFKKDEAATTLEFVREFMTDGRLIEIGGPFNARAIPLLKKSLPEQWQYKMEIDESIKHNPNLKAALWKDLLPNLPAIIRFCGPQVVPYLMKFSPYPAQFVDMLEKMSQQQAQQQQGQQQRGRGKQDPPEMQLAKIQKTQADVQRTLAQARALDAERAQKTAELMLEGMKLGAEMKNKRMIHSHKQQIDTLQMIQSLMGGAR